MTWVKLDDSFYDHPKVANLTPGAGWLHICGLCYCGRQLTDGVIPKGVEKRLTANVNVSKQVDELIDAGLWIDDGDTYRIHDFLEYQPSREKVLTEREAGAERQRKARERRMKEAKR